MEDKITIIEGPPPLFESVPEGWVWGLNESPSLAGVVATRLRTFNGPALLERCHRAWRHNVPMHLEYRNEIGLTLEAQIVAARNQPTEEGDLLILWVRLPEDEFEYEAELDPDEDDLADDPDDDLEDGEFPSV